MNYVLAALTLLRGSVRPLSLLGIVGSVIGFAAVGNLEAAKYIGGFGGMILAWWFAERRQRHEDGAP